MKTNKIALLSFLLVSVVANTEELKNPIDLECTLWSIAPSDNPKADGWWVTQGKIDGAVMRITQEGIRLSGALIEKTWEHYNGNITDWGITLTFEPRADSYNKIYISTLTGGGWFYKNYSDIDEEKQEPDYKVKCEQPKAKK